MAAAPSSLGAQFHEELTCSICLELFTRPKVLPCQHTFCQDCLQDHAGRGGAFQCPNCRQEGRLPPQGVAGLPDNHLVTSLCERLQNQATLSVETREQPQSGNRCCFHLSEVLRLYCNRCNVPVCNECLDEMHNDHNTITLKKAARERKAPVQELINEGRDILEVYCGLLKSLREKEKTLDEEKEDTDNSIIQACNHHLFQAEEKYLKDKEAVQEERDSFLADVDELSAACDRAEQELQHGTFVRQFPTVVSGEEKMYPQDVTMDGKGNLWMVGYTKASEFAVQYNKQGRVLRKFDVQKTGWYRGVAVDTRRNHILITKTTGDTGNQRGKIQVFRPDGTLVRTVGQQQGMEYPRYITVDGEGNILVSDFKSHCVFVYNKEGQFLFQFEGLLDYPKGICTDRAGNVIVADTRNSRVEMFDKTARFLKHITTDMKRPQAVAMATHGQLVVTDTKTDVIQIIQSCMIYNSQC
uniref:RING-type E3 ubiquitin transferase n=1 Tax=Branchiostoma floridae TaxID=7739 RepID=C3ZJ70_BRAFL|eukprot:XP_002591390.1 hypothetical protein BRAFLDRAFT_86897 [Branchiostoma floridae]